MFHVADQIVVCTELTFPNNPLAMRIGNLILKAKGIKCFIHASELISL